MQRYNFKLAASRIYNQIRWTLPFLRHQFEINMYYTIHGNYLTCEGWLISNIKGVFFASHCNWFCPQFCNNNSVNTDIRTCLGCFLYRNIFQQFKCTLNTVMTTFVRREHWYITHCTGKTSLEILRDGKDPI